MKCTKLISSNNSKSRSKKDTELHYQQSPPQENLGLEAFWNQIISSPDVRYIIWKDAQTSGGPDWVEHEEAYDWAHRQPPTMKTVGFVLKETDAWISITDSVGPNESGGVTTIPKGMILSMEKIR